MVVAGTGREKAAAAGEGTAEYKEAVAGRVVAAAAVQRAAVVAVQGA